MNTRSRKFVTIAAIILVVVTVFVSLAVIEWWTRVSWVEPPPFLEQINITSMTFDVANNRIVITARNIIDRPTTITQILVNNVNQTSVNPTLPSTLTANSITEYNITLSSIIKEYTYQVKLVSLKGNAWLYTATVPS